MKSSIRTIFLAPKYVEENLELVDNHIFSIPSLYRDSTAWVENDHGVRKTFEELVPKELCRKRVDEMCPPDWILLLNPYYIIWQEKVKLYQSKFDEERMSQFWFNTYFVSQHATSKKLFEDEPKLRIVRLDPDLSYFDVGREELDKAHKDVKETIFNKDFKVRVIFSEADSFAPSSSASLPRKPGAVKSMHKESCSMDSLDREDLGRINDDEDNFPDTDNEEHWEEESMLTVPQTTMVTVSQTSYV